MHETNFDPFEQRRRSLEEAFFKARDQQLLAKLRNELSSFEAEKQLAHVSGIVEQSVLNHLVQAGINAESLAAVGLVPLVEVAWCDGTVAPEERDAVLNAAAARGIAPDTAAHELLRHWLDERPDPHIFAAWKEYVHEMARIMPKEALAGMRKQLMDRAERVAAAAGGFLGLSTISKHERAKLDELAKAWDG